MKQLNEYLSNQIKSKYYGDALDWESWLDCTFPDDKKPRIVAGRELLWWRCYKLLCSEGPMTKAEILTKLGLKPTSYTSMFTLLSKQNIIVPNKKTRKLEPRDPSEWKLNKHIENISYHTRVTYN